MNFRKSEKRVLSKEEALDKKADALERREAEYTSKRSRVKEERKESR